MAFPFKYSFNLPIKAYSVNSYYYASKRIKTPGAKAYEKQVLELLEEHKPLLDMADMWRKSGGVFQIAICNNYPTYLYYNKAGQISAKTFDVTNIEKPLVDLVMNTFMGVNDRFLIKCMSTKGPAAKQGIDITLELIS